MIYLKLKHIFLLALTAFLGVSLAIYLFGGLRARPFNSDNINFDLTGFVDYSPYDNSGNYVVRYNSEQELNEAIVGMDSDRYVLTIDKDKNIYQVTFRLLQSRIVAQNTKYTMFLNENTTVVTVAVNSECNAPSGKTEAGFDKYIQSTCKTIWQTDMGSSPSNFTMYYIGSNSKLSTIGFNTFHNSVAYNDLLAGTTKRHYQIKFDGVDNGFEILYRIGDFTVINSFFPKEFKRSDMEDYFRGNMLFLINSDLTRQSNGGILQYQDLGYTWSQECAAYLEENSLATVTPVYHENSFLDEYGNQIPARYNLTDILDEDDEGRKLNRMKMQIGVDYNAADINAEGASPCVTNPFSNSMIQFFFQGSYYRLNGNDSEGNPVYNTDRNLDISNSAPSYVLHAASSTQFQALYEWMYKPHTEEDPNYFYNVLDQTTIRVSEQNKHLYPGYEVGTDIRIKPPVLYRENPYDGSPGVRMPIGGFHARDEEGNFLYDDDGNPVQEVFSKTLADVQNEYYGNEAEQMPPIFEIAMRFTLTEQGLEATIINESLVEGKGSNYRKNGVLTDFSHNCLFGIIDVLPRFTSNNSLTSEGQIIVPDGSGAIINFNSPKDKLGYTAYPKSIYGNDLAFTHRMQQPIEENQKMMFPMYGFLDKTSRKGVLAIVDRGANQTAIFANFKRAQIETTRNVAFFKTILRESETVFVGSANTPFMKWSNQHIDNDLVYQYQFLLPNEFLDSNNNIQYVTLAQKYRDYLIRKYGLYPKDETNDTVINLNFLGAFEKRELSLGFVHNATHTLTTFDQAREIILDLLDAGIYDYSVSYSSWTSDAMEPQAGRNISASRHLGGNRDFRSLYQFLQDNNINFYPESLITSNKGYDYLYGDLKYTAKSIGSTYAHHYPYVLPTRSSDRMLNPTIIVSPKYYESLINNFFRSYNRFGIDGVFLSDLGNSRIGDYSRKNSIFPERGMEYQIQALEFASRRSENIMLSAPFDFAFPYVDFAVDVPLESTLLGYYDYSIPFYQLVVSGLFDYAGPAVNYNSDQSVNWFLLKALETGSNLNFVLSYEDTKILLDTDYTMYFNAYFANWKNQIVYLNDVINSTKIHNGLLINHRILSDNVYRVAYSNGTILIINYNNNIYYDLSTGLSVRPNWFTIVQEGN